MNSLMEAIQFLGIPTTIAIILVGLFLILQAIGELLECFGKVVPEIIKVRKYFRRKKAEKEKNAVTLQNIEEFLSSYYNQESINKRNVWMAHVDEDLTWTHDRANCYDESFAKIKESLDETSKALKENTKMTEDMFVENSRDRIMDFAEKASNYGTILSHEQFRRIFRVHEDYEKFLELHNMTNGEVDIAYEMIQDGFKYRMKNQCFAEDLKGYNKK